MRKIKVFAAFLSALALIVSLGLAFSPPASAQSVPAAAPTGDTAESAPLSAPTTNVDIASSASAGPAISGISVSSLFLRADPLVKTVLIVLLIASLCSWMIVFNKWLTMSRLRRRAGQFEKAFWSGQSLDELYAKFASHNDHPYTAVFISGLREWRRAFEHGAPRESQLAGIKDRVSKAMGVTISREADVIENQLGFLASVASTAPFVGLFGTVWGIMNSFAAIAARHDTTLAVVAPGIAEALFATAMGLLAAIPAAFFYNSFVGEIGRYTNRLDAFADELSGILSRQLDEKAR
jgi:biopolymer transport protein TolQ